MTSFKDIFSVSASRSQISIGIICLILGFGLVTQVRVQGQSGGRLTDKPESDLTEIINKQDGEIQALRAEATELQIQLAGFEASSRGQADILASARTNLENMKTLVGMGAVSGPGVAITISDRNRFLTGFDIRQVVEELRASGAQATAVNNYRTAANTSFSRRNGIVYMDDSRLKLPYTIRAIGNKDVLYQSVLLPRGVKDKLSAFDGVKFKVERVDEQSLPGADPSVINGQSGGS